MRCNNLLLTRPVHSGRMSTLWTATWRRWYYLLSVIDWIFNRKNEGNAVLTVRKMLTAEMKWNEMEKPMRYQWGEFLHMFVSWDLLGRASWYNSFISSNLIHNSYINYIKLNASTCFERHPLILRRSMSLLIHVCSQRLHTCIINDIALLRMSGWRSKHVEAFNFI